MISIIILTSSILILKNQNNLNLHQQIHYDVFADAELRESSKILTRMVDYFQII